MIILNVSNIISSEYCIDVSDAWKLYDTILDNLHTSDIVTLDFSGITEIATCFINECFGRIALEYGTDTIGTMVKLKNLPDEKTELWLISRAINRYTEYYHKIHNKSVNLKILCEVQSKLEQYFPGFESNVCWDHIITDDICERIYKFCINIIVPHNQYDHYNESYDIFCAEYWNARSEDPDMRLIEIGLDII